MIQLSWGKHELGIWPDAQQACDFASNYMFLREEHARYDWPEIRRRAPLCEKGMSVGIGGLMFAPARIRSADPFEHDAITMARTTEELRRKYDQKEHPEFDRIFWKMEVAQDETQLGYWEWVAHRTVLLD